MTQEELYAVRTKDAWIKIEIKRLAEEINQTMSELQSLLYRKSETEWKLGGFQPAKTKAQLEKRLARIKRKLEHQAARIASLQQEAITLEKTPAQLEFLGV